MIGIGNFSCETESFIEVLPPLFIIYAVGTGYIGGTGDIGRQTSGRWKLYSGHGL